MRTSQQASKTPAFCLTLLCAAALTACGGGGSDGRDGGTSADAATGYSANGTLISNDATDVLDTSVQTAQAVVSAQAAAASAGGRATAQSATAAATGVTNTLVNCAGGGTATLTITGGTAASQLNGQLDTGEVYQLVYAGCRRATGVAALTGTLTMTVVSATATELSLTHETTGLTATLPRGTVTLSGSTAHSLSSTAGANGATVVTNHFSTPSLTLATQFNARQSTFTLSAVDITRTSTWLNGVPQGSSMNGTHTLSATLPNGAFSYTVATQGDVTYSAAGVPTSGAWSITLPRTLVTVTIGTGSATITVDDGKDGTIDRTFTIPVANLPPAAG
jgi:hypothetical protein